MNEAIVKKYVILIKNKKSLLININIHRPPTFIESENKALNILV